jgi:hypothetical protein
VGGDTGFIPKHQEELRDKPPTSRVRLVTVGVWVCVSLGGRGRSCIKSGNCLSLQSSPMQIWQPQPPPIPCVVCHPYRLHSLTPLPLYPAPLFPPPQVKAFMTQLVKEQKAASKVKLLV